MKLRLFKVNESRFTRDYNQMLTIVILNSLGFFYIGYWIPLIARGNMGATAFQISIVTVSWFIGRMISGFITGFITDRIKSKTSLILAGSFGRGIAYFIIYASFITNQISILGIGHATLGFFAGVFWIPFNIIVAEKSSKYHRSHAYGRRESTNAMGQFIGSLFGFTLLMIASAFTTNPIILYGAIPIYGISNFIAGFLFYRNVDESIKFASLDGNTQNDVLTDNPHKIKVFNSTSIIIGAIFLISLLFLGSINGNIARPFLNFYLIEEILNLDVQNIQNTILAVWVYLPAGILATSLAPKLGVLVDKVRPLIGITITSSLGALMTWLLINSTNMWMYSFFLLFDLAIGMSAGLISQNFYSRLSTKHRGKIFGVGDFFAVLGSIIGPLFGGIVYDNISPQFPFIISIFVELSLIPLYLATVYLLLPHMAESYEKKRNSKVKKKIYNNN
ncbi:MAG: MFS transporter [Promethearchaeota archaeon]|jgi:MFS family permease